MKIGGPVRQPHAIAGFIPKSGTKNTVTDFPSFPVEDCALIAVLEKYPNIPIGGPGQLAYNFILCTLMMTFTQYSRSFTSQYSTLFQLFAGKERQHVDGVQSVHL
jgi:hypothetical protein